jgi:hypothetical protein
VDQGRLFVHLGGGAGAVKPSAEEDTGVVHDVPGELKGSFVYLSEGRPSILQSNR